MNKLFILLSVFALHSTAIFSVPKYTIDQTHSQVGFGVTHMVVSTVQGRFNEFKGKIKWDPNDLKYSQIKGEVFTRSINTFNAKRDKHLKSPDFFNATEFPSMKFRSQQFKKIGPNTYEVTGSLMIKDITKVITAPMTVKGPITDSRGNERMGFSTKFTINRRDYNIKWRKTFGAGELVVGNDVTIELNIEGVRKPRR